MKTLLFAMIMLCCGVGYAQSFQERFVTSAPDSVSNPSIESFDVDNDGVSDIVLWGQSSGTTHFWFWKMDTISGPAFEGVLTTPFTTAACAFADIDADNDIDMVISGNAGGEARTSLLENINDFNFTELFLLEASASMVATGDLDEDGRAELVLSGGGEEPFLRVYSFNDGHPVLRHDSLDVNAKSFVVWDFDNDGKNDWLVSGLDQGGLPFSAVLINNNAFHFKPVPIVPSVNGTIAIGDLQEDGFFDAIISGVDDDGQQRSIIALNEAGDFDVVIDSLYTSDEIIFFAADFNSDGRVDLQHSDFLDQDSLVNGIIDRAGEVLELPLEGVLAQVIAHLDNDGALDLIQLSETDTAVNLLVYGNTFPRNDPPAMTLSSFATKVFDRAFIYWGEGADDHTPGVSLTYDLVVQAEDGKLLAGNFDLTGMTRLATVDGNRGSNNFALIRDFDAPSFVYFIQGVDNARFGGPEPLVCEGSSIACDPTNTFEEIVTCGKDSIMFEGRDDALWFSFADGLIRKGSILEIRPVQPDTLFYFSPAAGCEGLSVFTVKVDTSVVFESVDTMFVCAGKEVTLTAELDWNNVSWTSAKQGFIGDGNSIGYTTTEADTVSVTLSDGPRCDEVRHIVILLSEPQVSVANPTVQIMQGSSIQLSALGNGTFLWSPANWLDNNADAAPVASPTVTTAYTVTLTDSIGCTANASVLVVVEKTAFIPTLFTPNSDGKNDKLLVYGLKSTPDFRFTIHNRDGALVYETSDPVEAVSQGWDGAVRGTQQPSGVYYWKIEGTYADGQALLLNGKKTGSFVLVR